MNSLWTANSVLPARTGPVDLGGRRYDHVVIGGGLTGLTTALLLTRAGRSVAVLEARRLGAGATGNTTGKLSMLQGTRLASIREHHGPEAARDYVDANREGLHWLLHYCDQHDVPVQRRTAVTFASSTEGEAAVERELAACLDAGLGVYPAECPELPFPIRSAVHLTDQAQLDPLPLLRALADDVTGRGGEIFEGVRALRVKQRRSGCEVRTDAGTVSARSVVLATGTPILDRGGFYARLVAKRSYSAAFSVDGPIPEEMYLGADDPVVSLRTAPRPDRTGENLLLVGGFGHIVGRASSEQRHVDNLLAWTRQWFPSAQPVARWAAQDYESADRLPYIGPLLPGVESIQVATGFAKWGLTTGVAAALAITGRLLDGQQSWAQSLTPWRRSELTSLPTAARSNAQVGLNLAEGYTHLVGRVDPRPPEGSGSVGRQGLSPVGTCTVDGETSSVVPVCTHLLGVLKWNDADLTWDCPLHGSRFDRHGDVVEGPATRPLRTH